MSIEEFIVQNEASIRLSVFIGMLVIVGLWERFAPRHAIKVSKLLRWFVVTPGMHRVHHSIEDDETNNNFGFNLSWWDRLFGTCREQPCKGHIEMTIGITKFTTPQQSTWLHGLLIMPFIGKLKQQLEQISDYKNKPVITICRTDRRSSKAAKILIDLGFENVKVVRMGMTDWIKHHYPALNQAVQQHNAQSINRQAICSTANPY